MLLCVHVAVLLHFQYVVVTCVALVRYETVVSDCSATQV